MNEVTRISLQSIAAGTGLDLVAARHAVDGLIGPGKAWDGLVRWESQQKTAVLVGADGLDLMTAAANWSGSAWAR